jgi:hypothetical protein
MRLLSLFLLLSSAPAFADSLDCALSRGERSLPFSSPLVESTASAATAKPNELGLGLDSSLSPGSYLVVLQDDQKQTRAAFTGSPEAAAASIFTSGESRVACRTRIENPPKVMPSRPALPEYLVCVIDDVKYEKGAISETKRIHRRAVSTALFRLPQTISAQVGQVAFSLRYHRMNFVNGFDVLLADKESGALAAFQGPAGTLRTSFMLGLTQGDRAGTARFLRLGCAYANDPAALD